MSAMYGNRGTLLYVDAVGGNREMHYSYRPGLLRLSKIDYYQSSKQYAR